MDDFFLSRSLKVSQHLQITLMCHSLKWIILECLWILILSALDVKFMSENLTSWDRYCVLYFKVHMLQIVFFLIQNVTSG